MEITTYHLVDKNGKELIPSNAEEKEDTHQIFDFFKNHTSLLIAFASAIITSVSFFLNYLGYISDRVAVSFWGIPKEMVSVNSKPAYAIFSAFCFIIADVVLVFAFDSLKKYIRIAVAARWFYKKLKKYDQDLDDMINPLDPNDPDYPELKAGYDADREKIKETKEHAKSVSRLIRHLFLLLLFLIIFFLSAVVIVFSISFLDATDVHSVLPGSICIATVWTVFFYCRTRHKTVKTCKKEFKKTDPLVSPLLEKETTTTKERIYAKLSDENLKRLTVILVLFLSFMVFVSFTASYGLVRSSETFYLERINNSTYVLAFQNDDCFVFDEACVENDKLTINIDHQIYVSKANESDIHIERKHFDRVEYRSNGKVTTEYPSRINRIFKEALQSLRVRIVSLIRK